MKKQVLPATFVNVHARGETGERSILLLY